MDIADQPMISMTTRGGTFRTRSMVAAVCRGTNENKLAVLAFTSREQLVTQLATGTAQLGCLQPVPDHDAWP